MLLPPGFRADGYYMNGIPVAPSIGGKELFELMCPCQLTCAKPDVRWHNALWHLQRCLAFIVTVSLNLFECSFIQINLQSDDGCTEREEGKIRFWRLLDDAEIRKQLEGTRVIAYGTDAEAKQHIAMILEVCINRLLY